MFELVIGMGLLLTGFLAVAAIFTRNLQLQARTQEMTEASEIGRRLLEEIRQDTRSLPETAQLFAPGTPALVGPPTFPPAPFPSTKGNFGSYDITVRVEPSTETTLVEVKVAWQDGQGVSLQTFFLK